MRRPRIGIPTSLDTRGRIRQGRDYHYIDRRYADSVARAGGGPIHLPIQQDVGSLVEGLDGLLLPGGDDFASETPLPAEVTLDLVPDQQRAFDEALIDHARMRGIPILGICYGMQLMTLVDGGSLHAHLPTECPGVDEHRLAAEGRHPVHFAPDSRLAAILETETAEVNSLHHQAVRAPGPAWRAVAHGPDGVIEAIERAAPPDPRGTDSLPCWEFGVQWHPEKMDDALSQRLFGAFVQSCSSRFESDSIPDSTDGGNQC